MGSSGAGILVVVAGAASVGGASKAASICMATTGGDAARPAVAVVVGMDDTEGLEVVDAESDTALVVARSSMCMR